MPKTFIKFTADTPLAYIEHCLDHGTVLRGPDYYGQVYKIRRSGKTKTWKTRPGEFRIPYKVGFAGTGTINHKNFTAFGYEGDLV